MTQDFASDDPAARTRVRAAASAFADERRHLLQDQREHRRDALVDQAVGVVIARSGCGSAEAVAQLSAIAERTRRPLADVASDVVAEASGRPGVPAERSDALRLRPEIAGLDRAADGDDLARVLVAEALGFAHPAGAAIALLDDDGTVGIVGAHGFPARGIRRWRRIPPAERARAAIFTDNYGEAGAIELLGSRSLPRPYSGHNGFSEWGQPPPSDTHALLEGLHLASAYLDTAGQPENNQQLKGSGKCATNR